MDQTISAAQVVELVADFSTVFAALFAAWAAWESRRAANAAAVSIRSSLVLDLLNEYFDEPMGDALRTLRQWSDTHGKDAVDVWMSGFAVDAGAERVEFARRKVKGYFNRAARLYRLRMLDDDSLREVTYTAGINLYYDLVFPMDCAKKPGNVDKTHALLLAKVGRYLEGDPRF